jgi:hypothetical protein
MTTATAKPKSRTAAVKPQSAVKLAHAMYQAPLFSIMGRTVDGMGFKLPAILPMVDILYRTW